MEVNPYEKVWMGITITAIILMLIATVMAGFGLGVQLPGASQTVDPKKLSSEPPFNQPGVYEVAPGKYQVIMIAYTWAFNPNEVRIPAGSEVTFKITSRDVTHGMLLEGTNLNIMIIPGQISEITRRFDQPGTYLFVCHEYCGVGHQAMAGKVIVEP
ncbi:MAG: cytochrome C oxidase subunit II [Anaerolineae bacterium]|nr:cytochrome C oxidase subunit II [Anaerolineae bacterium]